jgi:uncharacterized membrane protein
MRNWLFDLSGRILCEQSPWCQRKLLACSWLSSTSLSPFRSRWIWTFRVRLKFSSANPCPIISRVSITLFPRFAQNLMHARCHIDRGIAADQIHDIQIKWCKNYHFHWAAWNFVHVSQYMLVLTSTVASRYYNCCTDGSTSPGNYECPLVLLLLLLLWH